MPLTTALSTPALPDNNSSMQTCPTSSAYSLTAPPANVAGQISGRITFDRVPFGPPGSGLNYDNPQISPARGIVVEALASNDGAHCDGAVVATTLTDGDGWYRLSSPTGANVCVRARAQMYRASDSINSATWNLLVADNTGGNALYVMTEAGAASVADKPRRDLHAASGWANGDYVNPRVAAPFAILDTACKALNAALSFQPNAQVGALPFYWSVNNTEDDHLTLQQGNIGSTHFDPQQVAIYLRGDADVNADEFDEMVIAHEFGHFVTKKFSRSDSIGGAHSLMDIEDPRLSFDEGWATAFAGLVLNTSIYRDSLGPGFEYDFDLQNPNPAYPRGWYTETSVQKVLFNAGAGGQFGGLGIGVDGLLRTFAGAYQNTESLASIFSYAYQLKIDQSGLANAIASLFVNESIDGNNISPFAENETNSLTHSDLPIYKNIGVIGQGGSEIQVCSTNDYDYREAHKNALSIRRYLKLSILNNGSYNLTVTPVNSGGIAGLELLQRGKSRVSVASKNANTPLTLAQTLTAGIYVMGVYHAGFLNVADNSQATPQSQCFKVKVTM
jgi:hypothetical protein